MKYFLFFCLSLLFLCKNSLPFFLNENEKKSAYTEIETNENDESEESEDDEAYKKITEEQDWNEILKTNWSKKNIEFLLEKKIKHLFSGVYKNPTLYVEILPPNFCL